jgi:glycosyltransferase involved in cell wall biosynthesis
MEIKKVETFGNILDPSVKAGAVLDFVLHQENQGEEKNEEDEVAVSEAISDRPILDLETGRQNSRVAFFTTDENVLLTGTAAQKSYIELAEIFDEVHVMVLLPRTGKDSFVRLVQNLWIYEVHGRHAWGLPKKAKIASLNALTFNGTVRPDVIIGIDPFEAGLGALYVARHFERPFQIHLKENFLAPEFKQKREGNWWRLWMARRVFKEVKSVRTATAELLKAVKKLYPKIPDLQLLPRYHNFSALGDIVLTVNLHEKYKEYVFILLTFAALKADGYLHDIFTALRKMLLNSRIGLLVVGEGKAEALFKEKVKLLGIEKNVVFIRSAENMESYLKTADILLELGTDEEAEVRMLKAAAAGLPALLSETELRRDLFRDGESAFLCPPGDHLCIGQKMTRFINTEALRRQFKMNAKSVVAERLHEDPDSYLRALRATIEAVIQSEVNNKTENESEKIGLKHEEKTLSLNPSSG